DGERAGECTRLPALPIEWGGSRFGVRHDVPAAGADCSEILAAAGVTSEEIGELERLGLVQAPTGS
ncbi:MAG: hypothetical protein OXI17_08775, partial [Gammaproteobacteria bacterium]|nr:hypothetical protein [Gammaproteobacteria bacterium]